VPDAWNTLCGYGLPDGPPRPAPTSLDFDRIREALAAIRAEVLQPAERAVLLAWLEGWRHHWPSRFQRELGPAAEAMCNELTRRGVDRDRFLKLRRIAVENLAGVL
jgi:hypothetical protein